MAGQWYVREEGCDNRNMGRLHTVWSPRSIVGAVYVVDNEMGGITAPVTGSGSCPACTARVLKPWKRVSGINK